MKLINKSPRSYIWNDVVLKPNEALEVSQECAKIFLKQPEVTEYVDVQQVKVIEEENEALKAELELAKAKEEATALGIEFHHKIGLKKLQEKIAEAKK